MTDPLISSVTPSEPAAGRKSAGLPRIVLLSERIDPVESALRWLQRSGYPLVWTQYQVDSDTFRAKPADVLLVHLTEPDQQIARLNEIVRNHYSSKGPIVILLATRELMGYTDFPRVADDFITGPFDPEEIDLRIKFGLWRRHGVQINNLIVCGDLIIDPDNYEVSVRGEIVTTLTLKEYELLKYLASNPERVFTREHLLTKVWDYGYIGGARTVDVHVRRLRMKIERHGIRIISTVRGVGYKFGE